MRELFSALTALNVTVPLRCFQSDPATADEPPGDARPGLQRVSHVPPLSKRLKEDSELAAVLADGVAFTLRQQGTGVLMEQRVALGMEAASLALVAFNPGGGPRPGRQWGHAQHQRADPDGRATRPNRTRFVGRRGLRSAAGAGGLAFARSKTCARRSVRFGVPKPQRLPTRHPQPAIQESGPGTGKRHPPSGGAIIVGQVRSSPSLRAP